jgi:hypothetical protein
MTGVLLTAPARRKTLLFLASGLIALGVCGCAGAPEPQLTPGQRIAPTETDLSGYWRLRDEASDPLWRFARQGSIGPASTERVMRMTQEMRRTGRRSDRNRAALAQVFLETGVNVKITQTADGLFISYDRSVVEEYLFGEHRLATVGPVRAERASGWQGDAYVIETMDEDGVLLRERWQVVEAGAVLKRDVEFSESGEIVYSVTQTFDSVAGPG